MHYISLCCPYDPDRIFIQSFAVWCHGTITDSIPWIEGPENVETELYHINVTEPPYAELARLFEKDQIFMYSVHHAEERTR